MCGACGVLGGPQDWIERAGRGIRADGSRASTPLGERQRRIALINEMLKPTSVCLQDFGGRLVLRSSTGRTRIVSDLAHVWRAADEIGRRPVDPLVLLPTEKRPA